MIRGVRYFLLAVFIINSALILVGFDFLGCRTIGSNWPEPLAVIQCSPKSGINDILSIVWNFFSLNIFLMLIFVLHTLGTGGDWSGLFVIPLLIILAYLIFMLWPVINLAKNSVRQKNATN